MPLEIKLPNIGDFTDVEVIEIHVKEGDQLEAEAPLITLESDKATMEIPAETAGIVRSVEVKIGDTLSEGALLITLEANETAGDIAERKVPGDPEPPPQPRPSAEHQAELTAELVVLGSGPGGYTAAFRAADLGIKTVLIERYSALGGVCLNVGCIPSKALLHSASVISEARQAREFGLDFGQLRIDLDKLRHWKNQVLGQLTTGLKGLARQRKVEVVHGSAHFSASHQLTVATSTGEQRIAFKHAIIAAGSQATKVPAFPDDPRIVDSTGALALEDIPKRLLVIGGGIIGLEMATVYHALGSRVTVVELLDSILAGVDADIVKPLHKRIEKQYENIYLGTRVTAIKASKKELRVSFAGPEAPQQEGFDRVLVAVGRRPNGKNIHADKAGVHVDEQGFIPVDARLRSNVPHIFAIGDIVGQPMLAHKAVHEGKVAAEVIAKAALMRG